MGENGAEHVIVCLLCERWVDRLSAAIMRQFILKFSISLNSFFRAVYFKLDLLAISNRSLRFATAFREGLTAKAQPGDVAGARAWLW
jgi:hypothetical protein